MLTYYAFINVVTFVIWGIDKFKAEQRQWRIPERTLIALIIIGGAFGALAGMSLFRHKTRKTYFRVLGIVCSVIHAVLIFQFFVK
ncbi:MAG: DUF1294 domain-containing protein [Anaerolineales bacterium]|nr:DUF1294 domain-containing protein [Anaerolineales bacterium]